MNDLSQELICHIASFLERDDDESDTLLLFRKKALSKLPPFATISRQWQYAIERRTFRSLSVKSTELPYISSLIIRHRRGVLANLTYRIVLPTYDDDACAKFENEVDKRFNNVFFTEAIHGLFRLLKSWEEESGKRNQDGSWSHTRPISLDFAQVYSPMDRKHRGAEKYKKDRRLHDVGRRYDLWEHRYEHSFLQLLETQDLPVLSRILDLQASINYPRAMEPRSIVAIAAKLSDLKSITWELNDDEKKYVQLQQDNRYGMPRLEKSLFRVLPGFAQALSALTQPSLQSFHLKYYREAPTNECFTPPSVLHQSSPSTDHLSLALNTISRSPNLTNFVIEGPIVITPEIYWPDNLSSSLAWPELRNFHVKFNRVAPNGDWYFIRDPTQPREEDIDEREETDEEDEFDSDDSDDSYDPLVPDSFYERREERRVGNLPLRFFRTMPDSEKITPFLVAMARAAGQMPKLQRMSLETELVSEGQAHFELQYLAPGQQCDLDSEPGDSEKPRLYLLVGKWRPEEEIIKLWTEHKGVDGDIIVRYLDW